MSTVEEKRTSPAASGGAVTGGRVLVPVNHLLVGHRLGKPVWDDRGVLLLAEGAVITSRFKELLQKRGDKTISADPADATQFTAANTASPDDRPITIAPVEVRLNEAAQAMIGIVDAQVASGNLLVKNSGPPLSERLLNRGVQGYAESDLNRSRVVQREGAEVVDGMLRQVAAGERVESHPLVRMAGETLELLLADPDCAIATAVSDLDGANLSDHSMRTSVLSMALGIEMGYDERNVRLLGLCSLVHDWGMCRISPELLASPRTLHPVDFLEIKKHPIWSLEMLQNVAGLPTLASLICYQAHERPDGKGYPRGRKSPQTHPFARTIRVIDTFSALVSPRSYRKALNPAAAMECLLTLSAENLLDADIVRRTLMLLSSFPPGTHVRLRDGRLARSLRRNGTHQSLPIIEILSGDGIGTVVDPKGSGLSIFGVERRPDRDEKDLTTEDIERGCR